MSSFGPFGSIVGRLFAGGGSRLPVEPGSPFVGTGLAAVAALAESGGARQVVGDALAGDPALAGALPGGLATALGLSLGGERAVLFLVEDELAAGAAQIREAVLRHASFVVCLASGTLDGARAAAAAGMGVLLPGSVAEAVDHVLAAQIAAERALVPIVVALDGATVAFAVQDAALPSEGQVARLLGRPADSVHCTGVAQHELFGEHRRRVPRWHDASRALRLGGEQGTDAARAALAGERLLFGGLAGPLEEALSLVAESTGRPLPAVAGHRLSRVDLGILACGGAAATAGALAEQAGRSGPRLGVLALRRLAPLPQSELVALAEGCRRWAVVERLEGGNDRGALTEALRLSLGGGSGIPEIATFGLAGAAAPLYGAELAAGCRSLAERFRPLVLLGLAAEGGAGYPKRQALYDRRRREVPGWEDLASGRAEVVDLRPAGAVTVAFDRITGDASLMSDLAQLVGAALGGHLHARLGLAATAAGLPQRDWLIWAPGPFADPGEPVSNQISLRFAAVPVGAARERLGGALLARVAHLAGREVKDRELRALGKTRASDVEQLLAGFASADETLRPFEPDESPAARAARGPMPPRFPARDAAAPQADGALGDPAYFWDQIGLPIGEGAARQLFADATIAIGALPAGTSPVGAAAFGGRPQFLADLCTGCAACWTLCPHGAIAVNAQPIEALLSAGIAAVGRGGGSAEALRRFVPKLVERLSFEATDKIGGRLGDWLESAGGAVLATAGLAPERLAEARAALSRLAAEIGDLDVAATPGLFLGTGGTALPGGALLALAVDPDRCTGCGLCVAECAPAALVARRETAAPGLDAERAPVAAMRRLPPSEAAAVQRVAGEAGRGELAAALLSAEGVAPLAGFDGATPGSAPRLAVRQAFSLLARALAPRRTERRRELAELRGRLAEAIHATLGKALPDGDLDALARGLESAGSGAADLGELATRLAGAVEGEKVNVARLGRLVEAARAVADLAARSGEGGEAAPLFSVVVGPGEALAWARRFPDNPFGVPATVAVAAPLALARGLALAEAERAVAAARVVRRARLEIERPQEALHAAERLSGLGWVDLDEAERSAAAPLVVLIDESASGAEIGEGLALLAAPLPVVVVALAALPGAAPRSPWWALAAAADDGIAAHATVAGDAVSGGSAPLAEAMAAFAAGGRGALVRVLAPGADGQELTSDSVLDRARRAVEAREFPLGCRVAAVPSTSAVLRADPFALRTARAAEHEAELAALEERHRRELATLEADLRVRLAERVRVRLLDLAARGGAARSGNGNDRTPGVA